MSIPVRNVRFGFSFYLSLSAVIHLVGFVFISFTPAEPTATTRNEVIPATVHFQQPAEETRVAGSAKEYMSVDATLSQGEGDRTVREATGLPSSMRQSPVPRAYVKSTMTRHVELPSPSELSVEFQAPETTELPENIREIDVSLGDMETIGRIPTIGASDTGTEDELMGLGEGEMEDGTRRRLVERPSFPYSSARPHLPDNQTTLNFELRILTDGSVESVNNTGPPAEEELIGVLKQWISKWEYETGETPVRQPVTIRIPGS